MNSADSPSYGRSGGVPGAEVPGNPVDLPVDGVLDLHTFRPTDVADVVEEYLGACRARGILEVRIIHGKGIGQLRRTVHSLLQRYEGVAGYAEASPLYGGWGATVVRLRPMPLT